MIDTRGLNFQESITIFVIVLILILLIICIYFMLQKKQKRLNKKIDDLMIKKKELIRNENILNVELENYDLTNMFEKEINEKIKKLKKNIKKEKNEN